MKNNNDDGKLDELKIRESLSTKSKSSIKLQTRKFNTCMKNGMMSISTKSYKQALDYFDNAIRLDPTQWESWNAKAVTLRRVKRYDECISCCDEAIRLDGRKLIPMLQKSESLFELKRYDECISYCDAILQVVPEYPGPWVYKAGSLIELKLYDEVRDFIDKGILIFEKNIPDVNDESLFLRTSTMLVIKSLKAGLLAELKQYDESILYLNQSIKLHPKSNELWIMKGEILKGMGKEKEAELCFTTARKLEEEMNDE